MFVKQVFLHPCCWTNGCTSLLSILHKIRFDYNLREEFFRSFPNVFALSVVILLAVF